jgi:hypothetical protein
MLIKKTYLIIVDVLQVASRGSKVSRSIVLGVLVSFICMKSARE